MSRKELSLFNLTKLLAPARLLNKAKITTRLEQEMADIAGRLQMSSEAVDIEMNSRVSVDSATSGTIYVETDQSDHGSVAILRGLIKEEVET